MKQRSVIIGFMLVTVCAFGAAASTPAHKRPVHHRSSANSDSALAAQAKITKEAATKIALAKVPGGAVKSVELEREHGKLIYSFDITVAGKSGVDEVQVSAIDGSVVSVVHENAKAEKKEAQAENNEHH